MIRGYCRSVAFFAKINELPQLWNVLIGEMSLVGPLTLNQFGLYSADTAAVIAKAKPGITGVSALVFGMKSGFLPGVQIRGNIILRFCCRERQGSDPRYSENRTLLIDVTVLLLTACVVLKPSSRIAETGSIMRREWGSPTFTMEPR